MPLVEIPNGTLHTISATIAGNTISNLTGTEDSTALLDPIGLLSYTGAKVLKIETTSGVVYYYANNTGNADYQSFSVNQVYGWDGSNIYSLRADRTNLQLEGYWIYRLSWILV